MESTQPQVTTDDNTLYNQQTAWLCHNMFCYYYVLALRLYGYSVHRLLVYVEFRYSNSEQYMKYCPHAFHCRNAHLAILNVSAAVRAGSLPKLAFAQVRLPLSKNTSPFTVSLIELALDHKFGYLLPHKLVRIVVLKRRKDGEETGSLTGVPRAHAS